MFWKIYRNDREQDMRELSQLLAEFFSYAAGQDGTSLDESAFCRAFSQNAQWLWEQFQGQYKNREKLHGAVEALFRLPAARRQAIAQAVVHDMSFDSTADPNYFFFEVPSLPKQEQCIVQDFFDYFYETAFKRKQGPAINGRISGATRSGFEDAYYQANAAMRHACPVCLERKPNAVKENALEHYFPRSVYFPLSLHPSNLMFTCLDCNSIYKEAKDALKAGKNPLGKVFLPYRDTVKDHVKITLYQERNQDRVKLQATDETADEQERVSNFDFLFKLEDRWSNQIPMMIEEFRKFCAGKKSCREDVRKRLNELREIAQNLSEFPDNYLKSECLNWLCETMFDEFYDSL